MIFSDPNPEYMKERSLKRDSQNGKIMKSIQFDPWCKSLGRDQSLCEFQSQLVSSPLVLMSYLAGCGLMEWEGESVCVWEREKGYAVLHTGRHIPRAILRHSNAAEENSSISHFTWCSHREQGTAVGQIQRKGRERGKKSHSVSVLPLNYEF